ncbi:MAG TPA: PEPxxWA-CTERM sorting domain-containing protein [Phenylobacterium sp.]|nr:PEPxxWA-CTERM sorting domain-containing protein [Phenylobacterium sp.]
MTFRIDVTGSSGAAPAFSTPFFETFTLQDGVLSSFGSTSDVTGGVTGSDSLTAGLKALVNLAGATDFSDWALEVYAQPGLPPSMSTLGDIRENLVDQNDFYRQSITGTLAGNNVPASLDAAGLADFFSRDRFLDWSEDVIHDNVVIAGYTGTATLTASSTDSSAAPEPAAWALTILGLGAVGASLRRRRAVVLAA